MMDFCSWFFCLFLLFLVIQLIRLIFADGDLTLMWKERFGLKPEVLRGQVVWVTGSSSGIGEYLAYELARVGCRLILSARREGELQRVKQECLTRGPIKDEDILVLPLDMVDFNSHSQAVDAVINHFGHIDVLVNNAGRSQRAMISDTSLEVDREMLDLNVLGQLSLTKAVLPFMHECKSGHIMVTSSAAGKIGVPFSATYSLTKFALHGWFESLRIEGQEDNIGITMVCPGPVFSDLARTCFTGEKGKMYGQSMSPNERRVSTQRCAELMAIALANRLDEAWISLHPVLALMYPSQYTPSLGCFIRRRMGTRFIMKIREGK